jgi:CxxC motif-containing protein (DUF1111 family)
MSASGARWWGGLGLLTSALLFGCVTTKEWSHTRMASLSSGYFGRPRPDLSPQLDSVFREGFARFTRVRTVYDGLGNQFNAQSCAACHATPLPGGSGTAATTFVVFQDGSLDNRVLHRFRTTTEFQIIVSPIPPENPRRKPPSLFGIGLLELVPAEDLLIHADPEDRNGDGISGRLINDGNDYGRFGWKGDVVTLETFIALALRQEFGITRSADPAEIQLIANYLRLLGAPPQQMHLTPAQSTGSTLFRSINCSACHTPELRTGWAQDAQLRFRRFQPYTDLLVHDLGAGLAEPKQISIAVGASEFRTPPLWGVAFTGPPYLHDGRASSIAEAILAHGGEAEASRDAYTRLSSEEKEALIAYVRSL